MGVRFPKSLICRLFVNINGQIFICIDILAQECDIVMHTEVLNYHCYPYISQYLYKMGENWLKISKNGVRFPKSSNFPLLLIDNGHIHMYRHPGPGMCTQEVLNYHCYPLYRPIFIQNGTKLAQKSVKMGVRFPKSLICLLFVNINGQIFTCIDI